MQVQDVIDYIQKLIDLGGKQSAILALILLSLPIIIKFFSFLITRTDSKDDKQFEIIYKSIDDKDFLRKLNDSPYLIKQLFYKRMYALKRYQMQEIEFLLNQRKLNVSLYQLNTLKLGQVLIHKNNGYRIIHTRLNVFWLNFKCKATFLILLVFLILGVVIMPIIISYFNSLSLFFMSVTILIVLEFFLINKHDAIKTYIDLESEVNELIFKSFVYKQIWKYKNNAYFVFQDQPNNYQALCINGFGRYFIPNPT